MDLFAVLEENLALCDDAVLLRASEVQQRFQERYFRLALRVREGALRHPELGFGRNVQLPTLFEETLSILVECLLNPPSLQLLLELLLILFDEVRVLNDPGALLWAAGSLLLPLLLPAQAQADGLVEQQLVVSNVRVLHIQSSLKFAQ